MSAAFSERAYDPMHQTLNNALCYFHSLYDKVLSYSALDTARSAISNVENHCRNSIS